MKSTKRKTRVWCEDSSPIFKKNEYERIGDNLLYNIKTSRIEKFVF